MTTATPQRTDRRPLLLVWLVLVLVDVVIGGGWDAEYHRTQPFDGFFSPPHVFIYTVATILLAVVTYMNLDGRVRPAFGAEVRVPLVGVRIPGALLLLDGACATLALAAPLDAMWHTAFGLDETRWSLPHAMLGASLAFFLGPLGQTPTPSTWCGWSPGPTSRTPIPPFHPLRPPGPASRSPPCRSSGRDAAAVLVGGRPARSREHQQWRGRHRRGTRPRRGRSGEHRSPAPYRHRRIPAYLAPASGVAVRGRRWRARPARRRVWGGESPAPYVLAAVAAPVAAVLGSRGGEWLAGVVREPARPGQGALALILGMGIVVPAVTGLVDLGLRTAIP